MNNYLRNLATRILKPDDAVKPRLSSVFESASVPETPPTRTPGIETEALPLIPTVDPFLHHRQTEPRRLDVQTPDTRVAMIPSGEIRRERKDEPLDSVTPQGFAELSAHTPGISRPMTAARERGVHSQHLVITNEGARTREDGGLLTPKKELASKEEQLGESGPQSYSPRLEQEVERLVGQRLASLNRLRFEEPRRVDTAAAPPVQPSAHARPSRRQEPETIRPLLGVTPQPRMTAESPAPIRVTIGRIDVRAIMQTTPSKPAQRAGPHAGPSLDDYLKRRSEGLA